MSLLDSIKSYFSKKKEDEILNTTPIKMPMSNIGVGSNQITIPKQDTSLSQSISNYFEPTPNVRIRDVIREIPNATAEVIIEPALKAIPQTFMSYMQAISPQPEKAIERIELPKNKLTRALFPKDQGLETFQKTSRSVSKEYGIPQGVALPLVALGGILDIPDPSDILVMGGKALIKKLGKEVVEDSVTLTMKELVDQTSPGFVKRLMETGGVDLPGHTITYDPTGNGLFDIIPKVTNKSIDTSVTNYWKNASTPESLKGQSGKINLGADVSVKPEAPKVDIGGVSTPQNKGTTIYHYGTNKLEQRGGTWFTTNSSGPGGAVAGGNSGRVEVNINESSLKLATKQDAIKAELYSAGDGGKTAIKNLKEKGFDGIKMTVDGDKQYLIFDESKISQISPESGINEITKQEAVNIIEDKIGDSNLRGWFRNADTNYLPKIEKIINENPDVKNSGLNIMWENYKDMTGSKISFEDFINSDITLYRGGKMRGDNIISYSMDKKMALRNGDIVSEVKIKPKDTLGSYQDTAEAEVLIKNLSPESKGIIKLKDNDLINKVGDAKKNITAAETGLDLAKTEKIGLKQTAEELRQPFGDKMIAKAKNIAKSKPYGEGELESIRAAANPDTETFISDLTERVRQTLNNPDISEDDAFRYVAELPNKNIKPGGIKIKQEELGIANQELQDTIKGHGVKVYKTLDTPEGPVGIPTVKQTKKTFRQLDNEADVSLFNKYQAKPFTDMGDSAEDVAKQTGFDKMMRAADKSIPGVKIPLKVDATVPTDVIAELQKIKPQKGYKIATEQTPRVFQGFFGPKSANEVWLNDGLKDGYQGFQNYIKKNLESIAPVFNGLGKKEREAITLFGEGKMTIDELTSSFPNTYKQIVAADAAIRKYYDDAFALVNESRKSVGLDPIGYTQNYYTIMQDTAKQTKSIFTDVPTDVRGYSITKQNWPQKFASFLLHRKGNDVENRLLDARDILDDYIRSAGYQIHITPTIEKMNNLISVAKKVNQNLPQPNNTLVNYINYLEYRAALLAGKKSAGETALAMSVGPEINDFLKTIRGNLGRNLVVKSPTSGFTNLVPIIKYILPEVGPDSLRIGMKRALTNTLNEANNFTDIKTGIQSQFLRNRYNIDPMVKTLTQKLTDIEWPVIGFKQMDEFAANVSFFAAQNKFLKEGKSLQEATKLADDMLANLITDRSLGQLPNLIMDKGIISMFTMFLPERINEIFIQYADTLAGLASPQKLKAINKFIYYTLSGLAINELSTAVFGRPFTDSIATAIEDTLKQRDETDSAFTTGLDLVGNVASQIPVVESLVGGNKLPITSAFPSARQLQEEPGLAALKFILYTSDPTGFGVPVYKAIQGAIALDRGAIGGPTQVKYPVPKDIVGKIKLLLLGQSSTKEAQEYYDRGYTPLTETDSYLYKELYKAGSDDEAYAMWKNIEAERYIGNPMEKLTKLETRTAIELANAKTEEERDEIARRYAVMVVKAKEETEKRAAEILPEVKEANDIERVEKPVTSPEALGQTIDSEGITSLLPMGGIRTGGSGGSKTLKKIGLKIPDSKLKFSTPSNSQKKVGVKIKPVKRLAMNDIPVGLKVRRS